MSRRKRGARGIGESREALLAAINAYANTTRGVNNDETATAIIDAICDVLDREETRSDREWKKALGTRDKLRSRDVARVPLYRKICEAIASGREEDIARILSVRRVPPDLLRRSKSAPSVRALRIIGWWFGTSAGVKNAAGIERIAREMMEEWTTDKRAERVEHSQTARLGNRRSDKAITLALEIHRTAHPSVTPRGQAIDAANAIAILEEIGFDLHALAWAATKMANSPQGRRHALAGIGAPDALRKKD